MLPLALHRHQMELVLPALELYMQLGELGAKYDWTLPKNQSLSFALHSLFDLSLGQAITRTHALVEDRGFSIFKPRDKNDLVMSDEAIRTRRQLKRDHADTIYKIRSFRHGITAHTDKEQSPRDLAEEIDLDILAVSALVDSVGQLVELFHIDNPNLGTIFYVHTQTRERHSKDMKLVVEALESRAL